MEILSGKDRLIAALTAERDELVERVRQLELLVVVPKDGIVIDYMSAFGLSRGEARVFHLLMERDYVVTEGLAQAAVWSGPRSNKIVPVMIHKLRRKLNPLDIGIGLVWGKGYRINPLMKDKVRAHMVHWRAEGEPALRERAGRRFVQHNAIVVGV